MKKEKDSSHKKHAVFILIAIFAFLFYLLLKPYLTYAILGLALAIAAAPLYARIYSKIKHARFSSWLTVTVILLIIIIPAFMITSTIVRESVNFISGAQLDELRALNEKITFLTGKEINLEQIALKLTTSIVDILAGSGIRIITSVSNIVIGLLIMFSIIYYGLLEGEEIAKKAKAILPFSREQNDKLFSKIHRIAKAVLYGEILIAIIQGTLGGLLFFFTGVPNSVFWGFIMAILAFLPFVGTGLVWLPAAIIKIATNDLTGGLIIITFGVLAVGGVDYVLRPKIISGAGRIHPVMSLIGAFGGLSLFGFSGIILGPLIASVFQAVVEFYYEDLDGNNKHAARRARA